MTTTPSKPEPEPEAPGVLHQPLHPSMVSRLDPQYVAFHDAHLAAFEPPERRGPWDPARRTEFDPMSLGFAPRTDLGPGGQVRDYEREYVEPGSGGSKARYVVRVYVPSSDRPAAGWPCLVWFRGGMAT